MLPSRASTHTHAGTHTHARTHARTFVRYSSMSLTLSVFPAPDSPEITIDCPPRTNTHARTRARTHARTHAHTDTHTHARVHHKRMRSPVTHPRVHARTRTPKRARLRHARLQQPAVHALGHAEDVRRRPACGNETHSTQRKHANSRARTRLLAVQSRSPRGGATVPQHYSTTALQHRPRRGGRAACTPRRRSAATRTD
jgi:hypothetical protein